MTNEEAIRVLEVAKAESEWNAPLEYQGAFDMAIEALKEQPKHDQNTPQKQPDLETLGVKTGKTCADAISRQDAIEELSYLQTYLFDSRDHDNKVSLEDVRYAIEQLPSAEPERKKGLWKVIRYNGDMQRYARCKCGYEYGAGKFDGLKFVALKLHNFCPNCGADMRGEADGD